MHNQNISFTWKFIKVYIKILFVHSAKHVKKKKEEIYIALHLAHNKVIYLFQANTAEFEPKILLVKRIFFSESFFIS